MSRSQRQLTIHKSTTSIHTYGSKYRWLEPENYLEYVVDEINRLLNGKRFPQTVTGNDEEPADKTRKKSKTQTNTDKTVGDM